MSEIFFFYLLGGIAVLMIALMIFQINPVTSALCLVMALFALSGLYVLLDAPFVAILQVLVYAGAIMVLFVFVIMLLKLLPEDLVDDRVSLRKALVGLFGLGFAGFIIFIFLKVQVLPFQPNPENFGTPQAVGRELFTTYLIPFELISVLLLVAMVGVVLLGRKS